MELIAVKNKLRSNCIRGFWAQKASNSLLKKYMFTLLSFLYLIHANGQNLVLNQSYYDSHHNYLLESNLTHYQIYFKDSLVFNWKSPECDNDTINTASLMKSITALAIGELMKVKL